MFILSYGSKPIRVISVYKLFIYMKAIIIDYFVSEITLVLFNNFISVGLLALQGF